MRSRHVLAFVVLVAAWHMTACSTAPTDPGRSTVRLSGNWHYVSTSRASAAMEGTLTLDQGATASFTGSLVATESASNGQRLPVSALASGRAADAASVEFDVMLSAARVRRHVASLRGDTLAGSWYEGTDGGAASGDFRAVRSRP